MRKWFLFSLVVSGFISCAQANSSNILDLTSLIHQPSLSLAVKHPDTGVVSYTKNGMFLKKKGYYYQGENRLQGFSISSELLSNACLLTDVQPPADELPAKATSLISIGLNLDASASSPLIPFNRSDPASYNFVSGAGLHDVLGKLHSIEIYYVKSPQANDWRLQIFDDSQFIGVGAMAFNQNGALIATSGLDQITFTPENSSGTQTIKIDLQATQYATGMAVKFTKIDGYAEGYLRRDSVDHNGYISQDYTNGQSIVFSKIAVFTR